MRIISGKYKGRLVKIPKGIRPTQDKVRKALFDILGDINGLFFLELFAGSGAVGIEALSHGAKEVVFVEDDPDCLKALKNNLIYLLSIPNEATLRRNSSGSRRDTEVVTTFGTTCYLLPFDVFKAIKKLAQKKERFDIIFLDPPYYKELAKKTLQTLSSYDILAHNGLLVVQHFKKDNLPQQAGDLILFKQSHYGDSLLSFYRKN